MQHAFQTRRNTNHCEQCASKRLFSRNGRRISSEIMAHTAAAAVAAQQHTLFVGHGGQGRPSKPSCATARYLCSPSAGCSYGHSCALHLKFWVWFECDFLFYVGQPPRSLPHFHFWQKSKFFFAFAFFFFLSLFIFFFLLFSHLSEILRSNGAIMHATSKTDEWERNESASDLNLSASTTLKHYLPCNIKATNRTASKQSSCYISAIQ